MRDLHFAAEPRGPVHARQPRRSGAHRLRATAQSIVLAALLGGCGETNAAPDTMPACTALPSPCEPLLYPPTFDNVFGQTLSKTCSGGASSCHAPEGAQGGLAFADPDSSWTAVRATSAHGNPRVVPGDAACSELVVRLGIPGHAWSMPRGGHLQESELCSIVRWVEQGAAR